MSYEGYTEFLCERGHILSRDCMENDPAACDSCGAPIAWSHAVDCTNGYDETQPYTYPAPTDLIEREDVWHEDHYGNRYATLRPRFQPVGDVWREVRARDGNPQGENGGAG